MRELPKALAVTERWAVRATGVAYGLLVLFNLLVNQTMEWFPNLVIGLILGPVAYWMVRGVLRFQRINVAAISPSAFRGFVWFAWGFGVVNIAMVAYSVIRWPAAAITWAFGVSMAVGFALAAARSWQDGEFFVK